MKYDRPDIRRVILENDADYNYVCEQVGCDIMPESLRQYPKYRTMVEYTDDHPPRAVRYRNNKFIIARFGFIGADVVIDTSSEYGKRIMQLFRLREM